MKNLFVGVLLSLSLSALAQDERKLLYGNVEVGTYALSTTDRTPFWLRTNRFGVVGLQAPTAALRTGLYYDYAPQPEDPKKRRRFDYGAGLEVVTNVLPNGQTKVLLPELYAKARFGPFEVYAGRRRDVTGLIDTTLSSGSFSWSGNTLPMPKIQIAIAEYTDFGLTGGILSVKGIYNHGWFENTRKTTWNNFLHQKALYGRLGKPTWPVRIHAGFNHQVQWGGRGLYESAGGSFPSDGWSYWKVITGKSIAGDTTRVGNTHDAGNRIGNHLGSVDVALEVGGPALTVMVYRQMFYDDGSLYYLTNIADGLNGLSFRFGDSGAGLRLTKVTAEFLYTMSQGGPVFINEQEKYRGKDDYYNHAQFQDGWSYYGQTIGTPFITPAINQRPELQRGRFTNNNRVQVYHLGFAGAVGPDVRFEGKFSYSQNFGSYNDVFVERADQVSALFRLSAPLRWLGGVEFNTAVGIDSGNLYPNATTAYVGFKKTFSNTGFSYPWKLSY
jgi:hypothetical protein